MHELPNAGTRPRDIRVALVDDHRLVLDGLTARLSDPFNGIAVVAAESSWTALMLNPEFPVDVVVIDLHLEDNIPIVTKLRALASTGTAAIVMSRHTDNASVNAAMQAGALGFIPKTESAEELITAIHSAASSERHLSGPLERALASHASSQDAGLGKQELRALVLYASGLAVKEVAVEMQTTEETIKSYIKRGRRKHKRVGVDIGTRSLLRRHAVREGWITHD